MRLLVLALGLAVAHPAPAQDAPRKKAKKSQQIAHKKARVAPTPEQIRSFNELAKKRQNKD